MSSQFEGPSSLPVSTLSPLGSVDQAMHSHKERPSSAYAGVRAWTPFGHLNDEMSNSRKSVISEKCGCSIILCLILAMCISVLSIMFITFLMVGVITPFCPPDSNSNTVNSSKPTSNWTNANFRDQANDFRQMVEQYNNTIQKMREDAKVFCNLHSFKISDEVRHQVDAYFRHPKLKDFTRLFEEISISALSRCKHEEFSVGMSSLQTEANSGEYYADPGFVITGVTCSSFGGFIGSLESRVVNNANKAQIRYKCRCLKISDSFTPPSSRSECRINYWQCPIDFTMQIEK